MKRKHVGTVFGAVLVLLMAGASAVAQAPTARERELEDLVRRLSDRIDTLEKRLDQVEGAGHAGTAQSRIEALEQVNSIKSSRPPSVDSAEWKKIREWVNDPATMRPYWKDALNFESMDGAFKLKIGGRIHYDWSFYEEDGSLERTIGSSFMNDSEFRRARIYIAGNLYDDINFKAQYDFAGGDADFKDVYVGLKHVPYLGNLRFGQFKEPFSIEELTSSNYITFMERSLVNTFAPGRNSGIMAFNSMGDGNMTWAAGVFRQSNSYGDGMGGRDYNLTARVTGVPVYEDGGTDVLHLGLSVTHQNYENDTLRFRARPETHLSPRVVDTGAFSAEYGDLLGAEVAWVHGPFSLQSEYVHAFIEGRSRLVGDPEFWAASLQASYFLTGEHRPYKKSAGAFGRVKPLHNYDRDGSGIGAWELAARYSYLNLNDSRVRGGRLDTVSLGLNWYLNPSMRMMWNYVYADASPRGDVSVFQWRVQLAF